MDDVLVYRGADKINWLREVIGNKDATPWTVFFLTALVFQRRKNI
jgi:hypothetical protein